MDCQRYRLLYDGSVPIPKEELKEYTQHRRDCASCRAYRRGIMTLDGQGQGSTPPVQRRNSQEIFKPDQAQEPDPLEFDPLAIQKDEREFDDFMRQLRAKTPA